MGALYAGFDQFSDLALDFLIVETCRHSTMSYPNH